MTVQSVDDRIQYIANGATTIFAFGMKSFDPSWINVYEDGVISVATFTKTLNADQVASPGGQIVYAVAPANGIVITILRKVDIDQLIDYASYSGFPAQVSENGLDKLTFIAQQLDAYLSKSVRQNDLEDARDMVLPAIVDRISRLMTFDQDGNVEASSLLGINVDLDAGVSTLVAGTIVVVFAEAKVDTDYVVTLGGSVDENFWHSAKTTAGFTISSSNASSTANVDWMALS